MRTITMTATLVFSIPEGMQDQQAFQILNAATNPLGVDFVYPAYPGRDVPVVIARVLTLPQVPKV